MKRVISLGLGVILLLSTLLMSVSCGNDDDAENTGEYSVEISTSDDGKRYDERGLLMDDIPEDLNYGGKEVNILTCEQYQESVCPTEMNNTVKTDTTYQRNVIMETRLGVKLNWVLVSGTSGHTDTFISAVANSGSGDYDLICAYSLVPASLAVSGYLYNLRDVQYLAFDKPWWSVSVNENAFYDTVFYASTTCSLPVINQLFVTYFNREMLSELGFNDIEQLVVEGKWTIEKLQNYSKQIYSDTDENQQISAGDTFGLVSTTPVVFDAFYYGAGFNVTRNNAKTGLPEFTMNDKTESERIINFINDMLKWTRTSDVYTSGTIEAMTEGRCAFFQGQMIQISNIPDSKNWGIIPSPKLDEQQEMYITAPGNAFDVWCIMKSASDYAMSGAVLECYASQSYRGIAPAYYEESLSYRYSNDENGVKIFEIIYGGMKFDFGRLSLLFLGNFDDMVRACWKSNTNSLPQDWATNKRSMNNKLKTLLAAYENKGE